MTKDGHRRCILVQDKFESIAWINYQLLGISLFVTVDEQKQTIW